MDTQGTDSKSTVHGCSSSSSKQQKSLELEFSQGIGNWQDLVGSSFFENKDKQLVIQNVNYGKSNETIVIACDSPLTNNGEVELYFLYEGQKNFGVIFRADSTQPSNWQYFAYNGAGNWQLGQSGGQWLSNIKSTPLTPGETYRLLIKYSGKAIEAFVDGKSVYQNNQVIYPNGTERIAGDWTGKVGIRLFGDCSPLKCLSLKNGPIGSISVKSKYLENKENIATVRSKWTENLVGNFEKLPELLNEENVQKYVQKLSGQAMSLYLTLDKNAQRTQLWPKKPFDTKSAHLTTQFQNIAILAKAFGTKGTDFYHQHEVLMQIVSALDFLTKDGLYSGKKYFGNWWDWQIGVPQEFLTTLFIIYKDIPLEKTSNYAKIMSNYLPNAKQQLYAESQNAMFDLTFVPGYVTTTANRSELALSVLGINVLQGNLKGIKSAINSVNDVLKIVTKGDGFYPDGSFIYHKDIPYTGTYGTTFIKGISRMFSLVAGTEWEINQTAVKEFVQTVEKAFIPLIVNGEMMPMVNGRFISRAPAETTDAFVSYILYNLLIVSELANTHSTIRLKEASKYWMHKNIPFYYYNARDFKDVLLVTELLANKTIECNKKPFIGSYFYSSMNRYVYSNDQVSLGISMYCKRISCFEAGNKENKRGWHTSDSMLYLFNSDKQFGASYWPTVDPYRLPGTTVDTVSLRDEISDWATLNSNENHVGGVTDTTNAVICMNLNKNGTTNNGKLLSMNLRAKKTWFIIDGKIISLGAAISGSTTATIETVLENRMLDSTSQYELLNQDSEIISHTKETHRTGNWLLLKSNKVNQNIGYVMLQKQQIKTYLDTREGTYHQINNIYPSAQKYRETYQTILIEHGSDVTNGTYAYLIYPNATEQTLKQLLSEDSIKILENNGTLQAIENKQLNIIAANIWSSKGCHINGYKINKPATFLVQKREKKVIINISNPLQTNEIIIFSLPNKINDILSSSENVHLSEDKQSIIVDTTGALGKTFNIQVSTE